MPSLFSMLDWILVIGFLIFSLIIGVVARRHVSSLSDFLVAGRKLRSFWGIATLSSTEMGLVTIVYFSEEAFSNGFVAIIIGVIAGLMMWLVGKTGFVIWQLRNLNIMTVPEYFGKRFNGNIQWIAGVLTFIAGVLNMGIFLQIEGKFLVIILGLPEETLPLVMGTLLIVVLIYTMLGGMFSVVITDVVQFILIIIGIIITTYFAVTHAGGLKGMSDAVQLHYGNSGFNLLEAPNYGLLFLIWTSIYYLSGWSSWQPVVQRALSMKDVQTVQSLYKISSVFMFFRAGFPMLWGIAALAILGTTDDTSTALPRMLVDILPAGLIGLVTIGFLSASMSTYDSYLLAFSSIFVQDIVSKHKKVMDEKTRMILIRMSIVLIGIFIYCWGLYYQFTETVFRYITLTGSLSFAGTLTALVGGIYWKRATIAGAYCCFIASAIPPLIGLVLTDISSTWFGLMSFVLAPIGMVIGSLCLTRTNR